MVVMGMVIELSVILSHKYMYRKQRRTAFSFENTKERVLHTWHVMLGTSTRGEATTQKAKL